MAPPQRRCSRAVGKDKQIKGNVSTCDLRKREMALKLPYHSRDNLEAKAGTRLIDVESYGRPAPSSETST